MIFNEHIISRRHNCHVEHSVAGINICVGGLQASFQQKPPRQICMGGISAVTPPVPYALLYITIVVPSVNPPWPLIQTHVMIRLKVMIVMIL